jgi:hypothetical protein
VEIALATGGYVPRVTGALVDALIDAAAGLDRSAQRRGASTALR